MSLLPRVIGMRVSRFNHYLELLLSSYKRKLVGIVSLVAFILDLKIDIFFPTLIKMSKKMCQNYKIRVDQREKKGLRRLEKAWADIKRFLNDLWLANFSLQFLLVLNPLWFSSRWWVWCSLAQDDHSELAITPAAIKWSLIWYNFPL